MGHADELSLVISTKIILMAAPASFNSYFQNLQCEKNYMLLNVSFAVTSICY
jgi:hypothetical protein